jgi:hypothetical protein
MKRLPQLLAVIVIGLLALQPAWAALTCNTASLCAMGASDMGSSCPMAPSLASSECASDCCAHILLPTSQIWAATDKSKALDADRDLVSDISSMTAAAASGTLSLHPTVLSSPPRHILHRVFRI